MEFLRQNTDLWIISFVVLKILHSFVFSYNKITFKIARENGYGLVSEENRKKVQRLITPEWIRWLGIITWIRLVPLFLIFAAQYYVIGFLLLFVPLLWDTIKPIPKLYLKLVRAHLLKEKDEKTVIIREEVLIQIKNILESRQRIRF
jgi:hypothetical protein